MDKAGKIDPLNAKMVLKALLDLYEKQLGRFDIRTRARRRSILNIFKKTWPYGVEIAVRDINRAQRDVWLAQHMERMKRASINAYILFLRQLFEIGIAARAIAESPVEGQKMLKPEDPIRDELSNLPCSPDVRRSGCHYQL